MLTLLGLLVAVVLELLLANRLLGFFRWHGGRGALFPWERGWKDTVLLNDRETVAVLIRFDGYRGRYLIHCHKLEHEDMGMMSNFQVV